MCLQLFLEQGTYRFPQQVADEGGTKRNSETFQRTIGRSKPVRYLITNKAPGIQDHDWKRVVAVFVSGAAWQFKDWPFKVELFLCLFCPPCCHSLQSEIDLLAFMCRA